MSTALLAQLRLMGVVLSLDVDGKLAFDAPADVLTDDLLAKMRAHRDELWALVEQEEERAAIVEFDGPHSSPAASGQACLLDADGGRDVPLVSVGSIPT